MVPARWQKKRTGMRRNIVLFPFDKAQLTHLAEDVPARRHRGGFQKLVAHGAERVET